MKTQFDQAWKDWITTNVNNGQDKDGLFKILLDEGFDFNTIVKEMNYLPSVAIEQLVNPFHAAKQQQSQQGFNVITKEHHTKSKCQAQVNKVEKINPEIMFIPNTEKLANNNLELFNLNNFLNKKECEQLLSIIRSKVVTSQSSDVSSNIIQSCNLAKVENEFIADIDDRICRILGIHEAYGDILKGHYLDTDTEIKEVTYQPDSSSVTYTMVVYLNDSINGGDVVFDNIDKEFQPNLGKAIIWNSLLPNGKLNKYSHSYIKSVQSGHVAYLSKTFRVNCAVTPAPKMLTKEENEFVHNYTEIGFKKSKLSDDLFSKVSDFYHKNKANNVDENVPGDFVYSSDKKSKSSVLVELPDELRTEIHDSMKPLCEEWCGKKLEPSYVYGVRVYNDKAVLKPHRDRVETHIIGVILNVDQEVNEDWPLIIEDNYYRKHEIMLKPGEVIFYESARLTHGRPIPFNGKSFANAFCHFYPMDYIPKKF